MRQNGKDKNMVSGYKLQIIAIALSKPSNKAIFFNNVSVFEEISVDSYTLKIKLTKLSTNIDSY